MSDEPEDPELDALIAEHIEQALAPVVGVLPPEVLDDLRVHLDLGLRYHAGPRALLEQLRVQRTVGKSGEVCTTAFQGLRRRRNGGAR